MVNYFKINKYIHYYMNVKIKIQIQIRSFKKGSSHHECPSLFGEFLIILLILLKFFQV